MGTSPVIVEAKEKEWNAEHQDKKIVKVVAGLCVINCRHQQKQHLSEYTNPVFWFSVKSQCSLVSNILNQPIRLL